MHHVHLITTGGTIEKQYVEHAGSMLNTEPQIRRCLAQLRLPGTSIIVEELMNKDSLVMTEQDRQHIAERVREAAGKRTPVLVTHGTDTLVQTGRVVLDALPNLSVPVVFTGAMTPFTVEGSDALQNLTESLLATRLLAPGVYLVFQGEVFPIHRVRKDVAHSRFVATE